MKRLSALAVSLACAMYAFSQTPSGSAPEWNIRQVASRAAVEQASRALESGDARGALEASDEARTLDTSNADARYMYAVSAMRLELPFPEAEGELRLALSGGSFLRYTADDAARLLAHILLRTKRYAEALSLLDRPGLAADPDALYLRARALRFLGDSEGFLSAVDAGLDRFPSDARIAREILSYAAGTPRTPALASRIRRVEARLGFYRYLDPEVLPLLAPFRASVEERRDTILEYRTLDRKNGRAVVLAVDLGILDDAAAVSEFFAIPKLTWQDLRGLRSLLRSEEGRTAFAEALAGYSGEIGYDANGDGVPETRTVFDRGDIQSWSLDFDQDGRPEATLRFRENLPVSGKMSLSGAETVFEYGEYPYVSMIRFETSQGVREYLFSPDALAFPIVEMSVESTGAHGNGYAPQRTDAAFPSEKACASNAYRVAESPSAPNTSVRVTDIDQGIPVRSLVRTADGRSGIVVYRKGSALYELADMDSDGLYESRYLFDSAADRPADPGKVPIPLRFEADFDLDGWYEYTESLVFPFERTWDYDGDGRVDARTTVLKEGGELREFSRRFDGRLDTAVLVRDGRIVRVLRAGVEIPLVRDAGGLVLWVGRKPFDFGASIPGPGPGKRGGIRYRVVRFGDQIIAETAE